MANEEVDRRAEILNAAVELFGTLGYYGTSLQKIADRVGLTKAGVLHYVGSKEGLLTAALDEVYDSETEDILTDMVREPRPLIADMWRRIVAVNARRPLQVHMFSTLSAEAIDPNHPAHEYFANRELHNADTALNIRWCTPEGVDTRRLLNAGFAMMDGVQLRWLPQLPVCPRTDRTLTASCPGKSRCRCYLSPDWRSRICRTQHHIRTDSFS